jgi:hypothetical protein
MGTRIGSCGLVVGWLLFSACTEGEVDVDFDEFEDAGAIDGSTVDSGGGEDSAVADAGTAPEDDAGQEPDSGPTGLLEPGDMARIRAVGICAALEACQGVELLSQSMGGQSCASRIGGVFANRNMVYFADAVEAGRVILRPEDVSSCMEDLAATGCDVKSSRWRQVCGAAVEGTVDVGGECAIDEECGDDSFCDRGSDGTTCPGECVSLKAETDSCTSSEQCQEGLVCFGGTCEVPLISGEDCSGAADLCRTGLICLDGTCEPQESVYGADEDEPCDPFADELCRVDGDEPLVCVEQESGSALCRTRVFSDGTCRRSVPSQCPEDQYCDAEPNQEGTCRDLPGLYEECRPESKERRCAPGLVCDTYQSSGEACVYIKDNGGTCEGDASCYSGSCGDDLSCAAPPACDL